jgi:hypothetical protein
MADHERQVERLNAKIGELIVEPVQRRGTAPLPTSKTLRVVRMAGSTSPRASIVAVARSIRD